MASVRPKILRRMRTGAIIQCPLCERVAKIDPDQVAGKVSILCVCGYHATWDLREETEENER